MIYLVWSETRDPDEGSLPDILAACTSRASAECIQMLATAIERYRREGYPRPAKLPVLRRDPWFEYTIQEITPDTIDSDWIGWRKRAW